MIAKKDMISLLGEPYVLSILKLLLKGPKRFVDIRVACPNERTRTKKLRNLKKVGLITIEVLTTGHNSKRYFVHYKITKTGKAVIKEIEKIREMIDKGLSSLSKPTA